MLTINNINNCTNIYQNYKEKLGGKTTVLYPAFEAFVKLTP